MYLDEYLPNSVSCLPGTDSMHIRLLEILQSLEKPLSMLAPGNLAVASIGHAVDRTSHCKVALVVSSDDYYCFHNMSRESEQLGLGKSVVDKGQFAGNGFLVERAADSFDIAVIAATALGTANEQTWELADRNPAEEDSCVDHTVLLRNLVPTHIVVGYVAALDTSLRPGHWVCDV